MSRSDARSTRLRRRPARVIPATIVAAILLGLGVGLVWVTVLRWRDGRWPTVLGQVDRWAGGLAWGSAIAIVIALAVAVVGVILIIAGAKPGAPNALALTADPNPDAVAGVTELIMTRRAVATLATGCAARVDGVDSASAADSGRRVRLTVTSPSEQRDLVRTRVTATVVEALQHVGVSPAPTVRTTVRTIRP